MWAPAEFIVHLFPFDFSLSREGKLRTELPLKQRQPAFKVSPGKRIAERANRTFLGCTRPRSLNCAEKPGGIERRRLSAKGHGHSPSPVARAVLTAVPLVPAK